MLNVVLCDSNIFREPKLQIYKCVIQLTVAYGTRKFSIVFIKAVFLYAEPNKFKFSY